ncbi:hypothetical protein EZV62_004349 [Acer yangbiense]|uniref:Non-haem dioxygenase N-terminal domain-containing protein n=1 Tax=Acer yangbiense TaxID=1000413 RepID=A0A5C7IKK6_9ROSI|nr:hypothetical protein EZV62_004349 [Acer yangbiense]
MVEVPAEILLSKRVQEMFLNDEEPPPTPYICRDGDTAEKVSAPLSLVPIIDLSLFSSSSTPYTKQQQEPEKLISELSSWGCFQV